MYVKFLVLFKYILVLVLFHIFITIVCIIIILFFFLGRVHSGMSVVKRMGMVETDKNDRPVDDVRIIKCGVNF